MSYWNPSVSRYVLKLILKKNDDFHLIFKLFWAETRLVGKFLTENFIQKQKIRNLEKGQIYSNYHFLTF